MLKCSQAPTTARASISFGSISFPRVLVIGFLKQFFVHSDHAGFRQGQQGLHPRQLLSLYLGQYAVVTSSESVALMTLNVDIHSYCTKARNNLSLPVCKTNWGKSKSSYLFMKEWNELPHVVSSAVSYSAFKRTYWL